MELFEVLSNLKSKEEFKIFFEDLCTYAEVDKMQQRIECAQLLLNGCTYNQVIEKTDISSATLSRVSRCIQHGSGGYNTILKSMMKKEGKHYEEYVRKLINMKVKIISGRDEINCCAFQKPDVGLPSNLITEAVARVMVNGNTCDAIKIKHGSIVTPSAKDVFSASGKRIVIE